VKLLTAKTPGCLDPGGKMLKLRRHRGGAPAHAFEAACAFLDALFYGPKARAQWRATELLDAARRRGITRDALFRAKARMCIRSAQRGTRVRGRAWFWERVPSESENLGGAIVEVPRLCRNPTQVHDLRPPAGDPAPSVLSSSTRDRSTLGAIARPGRDPGFFAERIGPNLRTLGCDRSTYWYLYTAQVGQAFLKGAVDHAVENELGLGWVCTQVREEWQRRYTAGEVSRAPWTGKTGAWARKEVAREKKERGLCP